MKEKTCCFTGHRDISPIEYEAVKAGLQKAIRELIEKGVIYFGAGGARGFDTLAAQAVLNMKKIHPHIKLILVLPCPDQTRGWREVDVALYNDIRRQADKVRILSPTYYPGCMHARNRHMVDHAAYCVAYCRRTSGGTAYTVEYATKQGGYIIRL